MAPAAVTAQAASQTVRASIRSVTLESSGTASM